VDETELISSLERLFDAHMHELRYNEPEYEREVLALMREIKNALRSGETKALTAIVERHCAALEAKGKAEFSTRLEEFKKAVAPFLD